MIVLVLYDILIITHYNLFEYKKQTLQDQLKCLMDKRFWMTKRFSLTWSGILG